MSEWKGYHKLVPRNHQLTNAIVDAKKEMIITPRIRGGSVTVRSLVAASIRRNAKRRPITLAGKK